MNTEPPTGDDLQRMLVSMKSGVIEAVASEPRPRVSRRHWGLIIAFVALLSIGGASGAVALGLVPRPFTVVTAPSPSATGEAAPVASPRETEPQPSRTPPPAVATSSIPATCMSAVAPQDYSRLFGEMKRDQLRPVSAGTEPQGIYVPTEAPFRKNAALVCHWSPSGSTEDTTNLYLAVGSATPAELNTYLATLERDGYACTESLDGRVCQKSSTPSYYGELIHNTLTFYVRGGTYVDISQSNVPTSGLLDSIVGEIWK